MKKIYLSLLLTPLVACNPNTESENSAVSEKDSTDIQKPNIVIFYVDDLGYGDLSCYGATDVQTPNVDRLAGNGIRFTDSHCPASTSTPSRYSLLTGEYAFRNKAAILPGDAPLIIDTAKTTLPDMLKKAGYKTAVVGKWHLGLGNGNVNWNEAVMPGPLEIGFDYSFLLPATGDRVPTVYLENHHVVGLDPNDPITVSYKEKLTGRPNGLDSPELLRYKADPQHSNTIVNGVSRIGYMDGGEAALWKDEDFPEVFTAKAIDFIKENKENPFFLYFAFHDIHVPRLPHQRFESETDMGPRGDAIVQMDWITGEIVNAIEQMGLAENTLIIFSSDNGPVLNDGYEDFAVEKIGNHDPSGGFRGGKYSSFEAGTRVPTIAYWKGKIENAESNALFSHIDLYASFARLTGVDIPENVAIDSQNVLDALLGKSEHGAEYILEEGFTLAIRKNNWKYIEPFQGKSLPGWMANKGIESGLSHKPQLYDLATDPAEQNNLAEQNPEMVKKLQAKIDEIRNN